MSQSNGNSVTRIKEQMERYHQGGTIREAAIVDIMTDHEGLIGHVIDKSFPTYKARYYDDMYSAGKCGLLAAIRRYDPDQSKPSTYFTFYIHHEIYDFVHTYINQASTAVTKNIKKVSDALQRLEKRGIFEPDIRIIAKEAGINEQDAQIAMEARTAGQQKDYMDDDYLDSLMTERNQFFSDTSDIATQNMVNEAFAEAILKLTEIEQLVILYKFGILTGKMMRHVDIVEKLKAEGISIKIEEIRKIVNQAMKKLKADRDLAKLKPDKSANYREKVVKNNIELTPSEKELKETMDELAEDGDVLVTEECPKPAEGVTL